MQSRQWCQGRSDCKLLLAFHYCFASLLASFPLDKICFADHASHSDRRVDGEPNERIAGPEPGRLPTAGCFVTRDSEGFYAIDRSSSSLPTALAKDSHSFAEV